jgi:hypothetical protein
MFSPSLLVPQQSGEHSPRACRSERWSNFSGRNLNKLCEMTMHTYCSEYNAVRITMERRCEWQVTYYYLCNEVQAQCWVLHWQWNAFNLQWKWATWPSRNLFVLHQPAICNWMKLHRCENELGQNCVITAGTKSAYTSFKTICQNIKFRYLL